jgi:hypothetical protein
MALGVGHQAFGIAYSPQPNAHSPKEYEKTDRMRAQFQ